MWIFARTDKIDLTHTKEFFNPNHDHQVRSTDSRNHPWEETKIAFDFLYYDLWIEVRIFWNFYKFWFSVSCLIFIDFYPIMEHEFSHFQSVISCGPLRFFLNFYYVSHDLSNKFWKFCAISFIFREERIFSWKWDFEKSLVGVRP